MSSAYDLSIGLEDVVAATGAKVLRAGVSTLTGISTDSRKVPAGGLFIGILKLDIRDSFLETDIPRLREVGVREGFGHPGNLAKAQNFVLVHP
jgi:hypothetical protein